jgi:uncharacterized protein (TIGR01777 family)
MKIAITGSTGLIGTALSNKLTTAGHQVTPILRAGSTGVQWDIDAGTIDAAGLENLDAVVHLAGAPIADKRWTEDRKELIRQSRVKGTTLLADTLASLVHPPKILVSGSAIGFYGDRDDESLDESSAAGDGFLADVCKAWEESTAPASAAGITVAHIRTGLVMSRNGGLLERLWKLYRFGLGGRLGSGQQWMSWIHLDDHIAAIEHIITNNLSGPVNLTSPNPVRNTEFNKKLADATRRLAFLPIPEFAPKLLFGSELVDQLIMASTLVKPTVLSTANFEWQHPTLTGALTTEKVRN